MTQTQKSEKIAIDTSPIPKTTLYRRFSLSDRKPLCPLYRGDDVDDACNQADKIGVTAIKTAVGSLVKLHGQWYFL
jgi:hypothetical protein